MGESRYLRSAVTWRYLNPRATVKHALAHYHAVKALCGTTFRWPDALVNDDPAQLAARAECRRCAARLTAPEEAA